MNMGHEEVLNEIDFVNYVHVCKKEVATYMHVWQTVSLDAGINHLSNGSYFSRSWIDIYRYWK